MISSSIKAVALMTVAGAVFAQELAQAPAIGYKDSYQLDYLDIRGTVYFTNAGSHAFPSNPVTSSDICVSAYVFRPITDSPEGPLGTTLDTCCSCRVAPNTLGSIPMVLQGPVVVKLVATIPARPPSGRCDPTLVPNQGLGAPLGYAAGMRAWSVSQPTVLSEQLSSSRFVKIPLGQGEQARLSQLCAASTNRCMCQ